MSNEKADLELGNFLAELDAEFGKKPKAKKAEAPHKALNAAFHAANPTISFAKGQIDSLKFENYYDWALHKERLADIERAQAEGVPELQWLPEALVTYVINQTCACCKTVTQFVGQEYVRFRGRRRWFKDIRGERHETYPTMLKPVAKVDGNLLAFGMPGGEPLPDEVEELSETVRRCAGCINLERAALDLWVKTTQPNPQGELIIDIPLTKEGL